MTISFLSALIFFKIAVTFVLVCLPFLLMTGSRLDQIAGVKAESNTFYRLYGIAILALLVGYATAFPLLQSGQFPWGVVIMGAISNGGAAFILFLGSSRIAKRVFAPVLAAIFGGLILSLALPDFATKPLI